MKSAYLNVTFRGGKALAAYYYLTDKPGQRSYRSRKAAPGLVVDYARNGESLGIEITSPRTVTLAGINRVLRDLELPLCLRLQRGGGVRGWGRDGLRTGAGGRGARARRALMSTRRSRWRPS